MSRRNKLIVALCVAAVAVGLAAAIVVTTEGGVSVPDLTGTTLAEATQALEDAGLSVGDVGEADDPSAVPGSSVGLLVSKGSPEVTVAVPDVTGMTAEDAKTVLAEAALTAALVEAYDADVPAGE
jgi:serine/threonine-protein kinase